MNAEQIKLLRQALITALDDDDGINSASYTLFRELLGKEGNDIYASVEAALGRVYLPETHPWKEE